MGIQKPFASLPPLPFFLFLPYFFVILLNLPALPHCFPLLPFGRGVILALDTCSDTWLLAARGCMQLCDSEGEASGMQPVSSSPTLATRTCWWPLAPTWPVALWSLALASIPPPTSLWLCRGFWLRPTPGFAGDLYGRKAQLCTALPRDAFRTRHHHLWLFPSPAESTAPGHGNFGITRQQKPRGANTEGYVEG